MCRRLAIAAGIVAWCVALPSRAWAQSVGELERRADSLAAEVAHLRERTARWVRSMGGGPRPADTLVAGDLTFVVTGIGANSRVRTAQLARELLENQLRLTTTIFRDRPIEIRMHGATVSSGHFVSSLTGEEDTEGLAQIFVESALHALQSRIDTTLGFWSSAIPLGDYTRSNHGAAYVELVTSPLSAIHGCAGGRLHACSRALGLTPTADPILEWYDDEDRRLEVGNLAPRFDRPYWRRASEDDRRRFQECLDGSDALCLAILRKSDMGRGAAGAPPFSKQVRADFLAFALDAGGDGAVPRLLDGERSLAARLSHAANLPLDDLVARWHAGVTGAKGQKSSVTATTAGTAIVWTLFFVAAAMRSKRWR